MANWQPYDRLVLDVLNDGAVPTQMRVDVRTRPGNTRRDFQLPAGRWKRIVLSAAALDPQLVDISQVVEARLRFDRTAEPVDLCLDNMMLLEPGEPLPDVSPAFRSEMVRRLQAEAEGVEPGHRW